MSLYTAQSEAKVSVEPIVWNVKATDQQVDVVIKEYKSGTEKNRKIGKSVPYPS